MTATPDAFVAEVRSHEGAPYQWGAAGPDAFDCSGLMQFSAAKIGLAIPRTSQFQYTALARVPSPEPGDLIFFDVPADNQPPPQHVGMYLSPGQMIDAPHTGTVVAQQAFPFPGGRVIGYGRLPYPLSTPYPQEVPPMPVLVQYENAWWVVAADGSSRLGVPDEASLKAWQALGYKTAAVPASQMALIPAI